MPAIKRSCKITGKTFLVSELEQALREKFDAPLPDVHPYERLRYLMNFRNIHVLYSDTCDLCGEYTLSVWGENPAFPIYCSNCWVKDTWQPPTMDLDLDRPFFDQLKELMDKAPHPARQLQQPIVNSDYCNAATNISNSYMCFSLSNSEYCQYIYNGYFLKHCLDTVMTNEAELLYGCVACHKSYQVFWSEFATNCHDGYFLYDCQDCSNCALSTGLRHKSYVFLNEQLTQSEYEAKIKDLQTGSCEKWLGYWQQFQELKKNYPRRYLIGMQNEDVSGNLLFQSKNVVDSYLATGCENCVNIFHVHNSKDALDMVAFGGLGTEKVYNSASIGNKSYNIQNCWACWDNCADLQYCSFLTSSHDSFGSGFGRKMEYCILNKQYSPEEYKRLTGLLVAKMKERGEYGRLFRQDMIQPSYNETIAQVHMPLTKEQAIDLGYKWADRTFPSVPPEQVFTPPDNINDVSWAQVDGKAIICAESGRPFKLTRQEFDFYQKYHIPLPRLHPEVRMLKRYPRELMFNLHEAQCSNCQATVETSLPVENKILCEKCYQEKVI